MVSVFVRFFFKRTKGHGFIKGEGFKDDAFVRITVIQKAGFDNLESGQKVFCEIINEEKGNKLRVTSLHSGLPAGNSRNFRHV